MSYDKQEWYSRIAGTPLAQIEPMLDSTLAAAQSPREFLYFLAFEGLTPPTMDIYEMQPAYLVIARAWVARRLAQLRAEESISPTEAEVRQALRQQAVHTQVEGYLQQRMDASDTLTTAEALAFLKISKPTLNKLRKEGKVIGYQRGKRGVLYKKSELLAYVEQHRK